MGKRDLYPTLSTKNLDQEVKLFLDLVSLCDGKKSLLEIAEILNVPIWSLYDKMSILEQKKLIINTNIWFKLGEITAESI